jgi:transposase-like protein
MLTALSVSDEIIAFSLLFISTDCPSMLIFNPITEYVINRDVTVSSTENTPAVSVSGMNVKKITNELLKVPAIDCMLTALSVSDEIIAFSLLFISTDCPRIRY